MQVSLQCGWPGVFRHCVCLFWLWLRTPNFCVSCWDMQTDWHLLSKNKPELLLTSVCYLLILVSNLCLKEVAFNAWPGPEKQSGWTCAMWHLRYKSESIVWGTWKTTAREGAIKPLPKCSEGTSEVVGHGLQSHVFFPRVWKGNPRVHLTDIHWYI